MKLIARDQEQEQARTSSTRTSNLPVLMASMLSNNKAPSPTYEPAELVRRAYDDC